MTHICVVKPTIIGSDNGLSPGRRQAITWTYAGLLFIRNLGRNFSEILSEIQTFSFKKMHLKMSSAKWRPFCLGLNVLKQRPHRFISSSNFFIISSFSMFSTMNYIVLWITSTEAAVPRGRWWLIYSDNLPINIIHKSPWGCYPPHGFPEVYSTFQLQHSQYTAIFTINPSYFIHYRWDIIN